MVNDVSVENIDGMRLFNAGILFINRCLGGDYPSMAGLVGLGSCCIADPVVFASGSP